MNYVVANLVATLREFFDEMSNEERLEVFRAVRLDYCRHCGRENPEHMPPCQCWNDD